MTKDEFLNRLSELLSPLEQIERVRMVQYYREIIDDRMEDGLTQVQAVAELEDLDEISARILEEMGPKTVPVGNAPKPKRSAFSIVLIALGSPVWLALLVAAGAVLLSMYVVAWALVVSLFAVVLALCLAGLAGVVGLCIYLGSHAMTALFLLGAGLVCAAFGLAMFFPVCLFARWLIAGTAKLGRRAWDALWRRKKGAA